MTASRRRSTSSRAPESYPLSISGGAPSHDVQFYEDEQFLYQVVADYLAEGLTVGQALIVIATEPHRDAFVSRLAAEGFDVDGARQKGWLTLLDAKDTLASFMVDAMPDAGRFSDTIGAVIDRSRAGNDNAVLRLYGEMVDVLWKEGNSEAAIRLEELWNDLGRSSNFSLLCAYSMGAFHKSADGERFQKICQQHMHVIPTERYVRADEHSRLREISVLQQRAVALEAEILRRGELERELSAALAERSRLLERERAAREHAERADRAKSQFLAMMSHELRTPLNAIGGHVQLIEMGVHGPVTDAQREALLRVERSHRHLLALINDVLNLTRIEAGRVEYALESVMLEPLLGEVLATLEPLFAVKGLVCETSLAAGDRVTVHADRERVHQIVLNLLTNAIKFTPAGGRVAVAAGPSSDGTPMTVLTVSDTGVGIPRSQMESIFEPFVQLTDRPASRRDGIGLGLAISRDLARGMGGTLTVESTVGVGSTFTLTLPAG